ncbi:ComEC/Rec2 family competence protein [Gaoshiqia sp. Z1-71]|uniref:ComEC/Rec2 family competence protein n=1 Tax=Gaoshiqia hydrogeniformans TaxID=3290090 RepID=UPI003BF826C7
MRKTMIIRALFLFLLCGGSLYSQGQVHIGDQLPLWKEGFLDIHHINTGKGECTFFMLPDGTTLLVDAGATARPKPRVTDPKPDGSRTPGEWISRYILHFLQNRTEKKLNYVLLTHFHDDHIGETYSGQKTSKDGDFILTGITEVGAAIPFDKIVDRNWPAYDYPKPLGAGYIANYIRFVKWNIENNGVQAEQFQVGANDQFPLVYQPEKYTHFEIRNLASNGQVWTGVGNNVRNHFPPLETLPENQYPGENACSSAFRLSYGKFDYFNGGDLTTGAPGSWQDIETPVGLVTGPVDVCIANHHAYYDAMGVSFLQAVRPRVHIIQVWAPSHPSPSVLARMMSGWTYPGPRDIFATNTMEETRVVSGRMDDLKSQQGHIVVRVSPGGENYMIYILDDSAESFKVKAVHGPYNCE